jgi:cytochrome oxidase Cu insertion factor (SCO1/SenC/PrrC family)
MLSKYINKHLITNLSFGLKYRKTKNDFINFNKFNLSTQNQKENFRQNQNLPEEFNNLPPPDEKRDLEYESDEDDGTSFYNRRRRLYYILATSATILTGVYFGLYYLKPDETIASKKRFGEVTYVGKAQIGGPWKMMDTFGNIISHKDFSGKYYLIYFGFTQCPDVCPMSLQKIAKLLKRIRQSKEYKYFDIECIFVSVDPDRDTLERIKNYCKLFDDKIIGITSKSNDDPELKLMLKSFKIHSSKIYMSKEDEEEDMRNLKKNVPDVVEHMQQYQTKPNMKYSLDHTIVTYLMGPNNNFITYLSANLNPDEMYNIVLDEVMHDLTKQLKSLPREKN